MGYAIGSELLGWRKRFEESFMTAAVYARKSTDQSARRRRSEERHPAGCPRKGLRHPQGLDSARIVHLRG
jgi:hypothetical protein